MSILKVVDEEAVGIFHVSTSDPHRLVLHLALLFMIVFASESVFDVGLNKVYSRSCKNGQI